MAKPKQRVTASGTPPRPEDNPFSGLAGLAGALPNGPEPPAPDSVPIAAAPAWTVARTRKGGWPLAIEKRAGGRCVTVLTSVSGDAEALLTLLRKHCGSGGAVREGAVEIQGDHRSRIEAFLGKNA
jgi:translation initiation factor 1